MKFFQSILIDIQGDFRSANYRKNIIILVAALLPLVLIQKLQNNFAASEFIVSALGICAVILIRKKKISNFYVGIFSTGTYAIFAWHHNHLVNEAIAWGFVMFPLQFVGIRNWRKHKQGYNLEVQCFTKKAWVRIMLLCLCALGLVFALKYLTYSLGGSLQWLDSVNSAFQYVAILLMLNCYREQWLFWIAANITSMLLWYVKASLLGYNYGLLYMFAFYLFNSVLGYREWWHSKSYDHIRQSVARQ